MPTFDVIRKSDGVRVYQYGPSDAPVEWEHFPFQDFDHVEHVEVEPPPPVRYEWDSLDVIDFMRRFTTAERIAIRAAEKVDPVVADFFDLLRQAPQVRSANADVHAGLGYLVSQGLLTSARRDAILGVIGG